jgi:aryl-alcohol dehydrogenase-like predicted oxidoreductase
VRYRAFGRGLLRISEIGFGCGPTAGLMINADAASRRRAVRRALELGINYFDTAASYGNGQSEKHLGQALAELGASAVIASKVTLELADLGNIGAAIEESVEESRRRLGVERIDVLHLHNRVGAARAARSEYGSGALLTTADVLGRGGVAETFRRLISGGRIGHAGCCAFGGEAHAVKELIESGTFSSVIVRYSVLNATAWRSPAPAPIQDYRAVGAVAAGLGMAVIGLRILEGGVLSGYGFRRPGDEGDRQRRWDLQRVDSLGALRGEGEDSVQLAIRFALSNPSLSTALIGFSDMAQIEQAVDYAHRGPLTELELAKIEELRGRDFGLRSA